MSDRKWFLTLVVVAPLFFGWGYFWGHRHIQESAHPEIAMSYGTGTSYSISPQQMADTTATFSCFSGPPPNLAKLPKAKAVPSK